jgi:hypothetical protein
MYLQPAALIIMSRVFYYHNMINELFVNFFTCIFCLVRKYVKIGNEENLQIYNPLSIMLLHKECTM